MIQIDYDKWHAVWRDSGIFTFKEKSNKQIYVIDTPPPFTSGDLHVGQVFWVVYTDSTARYMHMKGYNVLYPVGWDTQGFPTELLAEKKYGKNMQRDEFYQKCTEIAKANMLSMKAQMRRIGATFDESREYITMSPSYRKKVQLSLIEMHKKGFVYRAKHPIEWCPRCNSSITREETEDVERDSVLNYIEFSSGKKKFEIATTRPELLHACVAIAVNPNDKRYKSIIGKSVEIPIFDRKVTVIADEIVDMKFGTGAEMVCTFGDKNDVMLFYKHKLAFIESLSGQGLIINSGKYDGISTAEARKAILKDLERLKLLKKQEPVKQSVRVHERCKTPIELISAVQWFIKTKEYAEKIKDTAKNIDIIPKFKLQNIYDWVDYIEWDWNISRNRIFGTPIPFWYCDSCGHIIPASEESLPVNPSEQEPPVKKCPKCGSQEIVGEKDTCDVWVDSSITPLVIAGWPDNKELFKKAFPSTLRIQGSDIIRTWGFYTIFRTWALTGKKPFEHMLIHGMILGKDGKEMHKSLGNGVVPEELLQKYSVDAIRLWVALNGAMGKDKSFSFEELNYATSFINKVYNSALFVKNAYSDVDPKKEPVKDMNVFDMLILSKLNDTIKSVEESYDNLDLYSASTKLMNFYWHDFCDYYIENVKYRIHSEDKKMNGSKNAAAFTLMHVLKSTLQLLAPIAPFVSEEINAMFSDKSIFLSELPKYTEKPDNKLDYVINGVIFSSSGMEFDYEEIGNMLNDVISEVRKLKSNGKIALNKEIKAININLPELYHNALLQSKEELINICKAKSINISKSKDFSVSIDI